MAAVGRKWGRPSPHFPSGFVGRYRCFLAISQRCWSAVRSWLWVTVSHKGRNSVEIPERHYHTTSISSTTSNSKPVGEIVAERTCWRAVVVMAESDELKPRVLILGGEAPTSFWSINFTDHLTLCRMWIYWTSSSHSPDWKSVGQLYSGGRQGSSSYGLAE